MGLGKLKCPIDIICKTVTKDDDGFGKVEENTIATVRAYREDRYASEKWTNLATFSEANALFRFRKLSGKDLSTDMVISTGDERFDIISVRDIRNRGMFTEVLAKKVVGSGG